MRAARAMAAAMVGALGAIGMGTAQALPSPEPAVELDVLRAVDPSGRYVLVQDDPVFSHVPDDWLVDRLSGTVTALDRVVVVGSAVVQAITVGDQAGDLRWTDLRTGTSTPVSFTAPAGRFLAPKSMSADGGLMLAGLGIDPVGVDGVSKPGQFGVFVLDPTGHVEAAPMPDVAPVDISANGRWVLMYRNDGPTLGGPQRYVIWDRASGRLILYAVTVMDERGPIAIGDDRQVYEYECLVGDPFNGGDVRHVVRRRDGSVLEFDGIGGAEISWLASDDVSTMLGIDLSGRLVTVDTATGSRAVISGVQVERTSPRMSTSGSLIALAEPEPERSTTTSDLEVVTAPGRVAAPKVQANERMVVQVAGEGGVPDDATAVVLNVTVTKPAGPGFATVWPCGAKPNASNVNFTASGTTVANAVVAKLSSSGTVCISPSVAAELIVDAQGYFAGSAYVGVVPDRVADSREGESDVVPNLARGARFVVPVAGVKSVPEDASAVVVNVTAANTAGPGYLTVWPCDESRPDASNVNFTAAGATVANAVVAKVADSGADDGSICVYTSVAADVIVDVQGYFTGSAYVGVLPDRVADSRGGETDLVPNLAAGARFVVPVAGVKSVPEDASAVVVNVTATNTAGPGYLTVWPCDESRPDASNVNFTAAGATVANAVVAKVADSGADDGSICVYTSVAADVIVDVQGYFTGTEYSGVSPSRIYDTRG